MANCDENDFVWQDREIRFDVKRQVLDCRKGEKVIDSINSVEDTKGNNGERGSLVVTNLRIIWTSHANSNINLSIGLSTIMSVNIRKAKSKLRGHTQALCVFAKFNSRFEFIFTSLVKNSPRLFTTIQTVMRAYETSKLYRELKLRGSIVKDGELILLPHEQIFSRVNGVWNLSSDQGNLGTFFLTNVRLVWHANLASNFNVSLPYMQVKSIRVRESKFGRALVIETFPRAGGYILGFRVDPIDKLDIVNKELLSLFHVFSASPIFGVDFTIEGETPTLPQVTQPRVEEDVDIIEEQEDSHAVAAYYAGEGSGSGGGGGIGGSGMGSDVLSEDAIQYHPKLGLAIEQLHDGMSLEQLWRVI